MSASGPVPTTSPAAGRAVFASPFQRLNDLVAGIQPGKPPIVMAVGEPRHPVPGFVGPVLAGEIDGFGRYPAIKGTDAFRAAVAGWLGRRYGIEGRIDPATMVLPLNGSREGLFFAALEARMSTAKSVPNPAILVPNPFYQAYAAGCVAAGCEPVLVAAGAATGFLPDPDALDPALLARTVAMFFASPANPQGAVVSREGWQSLIELARRHDFVLLADECYSEIYRDRPPAGVLEAAAAMDGGFDRVVAFNSLSKRSNLPGLRCGFAAGDPAFLQRWAAFRNMAAPQVPNPVQAVAVAALADEVHVIENRRLYNAKYEAAERILGPRFGAVTPPGGFFLWLDVGHLAADGRDGGENAALALWREAGVRTVPGGYLAAAGPDGRNPGADFLRVAMVDDLALTEEGLRRIAAVLAPPGHPSE
ncbi:aminotransferase class I/II-fold pyridoxal phosphate-dependent enzyme [Prosthecomicrobium sp. N25]|uniref:aminotransferase class I/II-fold pyridoxal phosphate-dependent enzyme n=1 Tax=Prosthecomicrobium sp. N25 TaxID=3129254 RepID=UPI003077398E